MATSFCAALASRLRMANVWLFIAFFLVMIWLPLLDSWLDLDQTPRSNEKRELAAFPKLTPGTEGAREFFSGLDNYYADHFGLRNWLVHRQRQWKRKWFGERAGPNVIEGRDGWYFYTGARMIDHATGRARFDEAALHAWRDLLETRRNWLAARGIAYLFVVPPDKHTVYPEYLPDWLRDATAPGKLSQLVDYMKANSTVPVLDLRLALTDAKKTSRQYWFTDTHWNMEGGFVAYQAVVRAMALQLPGTKPLDATQFSRSSATKSGGDLATLLGQRDLMEKDFVELTPLPPLKGLAMSADASIYPKAWPKDTEPQMSLNPDAVGTAIVFRDSFANGWLPFLGYHFNRLILIWDYRWNPDLIEREKLQVVIDEILERYMNVADPLELKAKDGLDTGAPPGAADLSK